jgi:NAD/NADP transhydrogenase beta subunit
MRRRRTSAQDERRKAATLKRLRRLAWALDESLPLPGGYRIGLDGLIGLIPGVGDLAGALLSSYIVGEAVRLGVSRSLLIRMVFNVFLDTLIGTIPFLGDVFDFVYKANLRNLELLGEHVQQPESRRVPNVLIAGAVVLGLMACLVALIAGVVALWHLIAR